MILEVHLLSVVYPSSEFKAGDKLIAESPSVDLYVQLMTCFDVLSLVAVC